MRRITTILIFLFATPSVLSQYGTSAPEYFDMLVVGDSHIAGQGLKEKNKFYFLVKEWLEKELLGQPVRLNVKAHAGAKLDLTEEDLKHMKELSLDVTETHGTETNLSQPSAMAQIKAARKEYDDPGAVDLVMITGCITDVKTPNTINPFYSVAKLRKRIKNYCGETMHATLDLLAREFPNATIVVSGYYPILAGESDIKKMLAFFLEIIRCPKQLRFLFTNGLSRQGLKMLRDGMVKRSRIWIDESNRAIRGAVDGVNSKLAKPRIVFVETPIKEENAFGSRMPMVFEMNGRGRVNDETTDERAAICEQVFQDKRMRHYGKLSSMMCVLSSIAHPNVLGSQAYAENIKVRLKPLLAKY